MTVALGALSEQVRAIRESVALGEPTDTSMIRVIGEGAYDAVDALLPIDLYLREGQVRQTLLLDEHAHPLADVYIAADSDGFLIVAEGLAKGELVARASEHAGPDVEIVDLAATHRVLELSGPFAWEVLAAIEGQEVVGFPYLMFYRPTPERIYLRAGKTGEYGYDLIVPNDEAPALREQLLEAGERLDMRVVGREAIWHTQLESWFFNIHREGREKLTPIELGLQWRLSTKKNHVGSAALEEHRNSGARRRLVPLRSASPLAKGDDVHVVSGSQDERVGEIVYGERSLSLGDWIAMALIDAPFWHSGIDAFRVHGAPARSVSAPFVTQRSLFVNPQKHSYKDRAEIQYPP